MVKKRSTPKKVAAKKSIKRSKFSDNYVSFKLQPNERPFIQFAVTRQTVYWTLISLLILFLGVYVVKLQMEVSSIYDQIDANSMQSDTVDTKDIKKKN